MITAFHGIGAYRGQKNPIALSRQLTTALSGVEICGADRPIGAFGCVLFGEARAVYDQDCWSRVGKKGLRQASGWVNKVLECPEGQEAFEKFALEALAERAGYPDAYCEAWISAVALRAVWVKDWASIKTQTAARIIAKHRGVPLMTVKGTTRIWDVLDNHKLPLKMGT
ncbi:MAG: hypothetical protein LAT63_17480 [Marinobacter sp.]|nr:hypothetical protein [Marinobacter sp.]